MAKVQMQSACSSLRDPKGAAEDIVRQLSGDNPKLVTLFASRSMDHGALNAALRERLPASTRLVGASTGGEIDRSGLHSGTVVVGALSGDFDVGLGLGRHLSADALSAGASATARAREELGVRATDIDPRRHVGLVIDDGFRNKKEELLLGILERNPALVLVGGGASDEETDPGKRSALIHVDGEVVDDAALVALFRVDAPFAALRSHSFLPTGKTLTITKLDDDCRRVIELDGQPATERYAEAIGVPVSDLDYPNMKGLMGHPLALHVGREYFLRAAWFPQADGSIVFGNLLEEGAELDLMRSVDLAESTRRFFEEEVPRRVRSPQAALLFNCGARHWTAASTGRIQELSNAFTAGPPSAGMNAWFEIYCGFNISFTLTALVFGASE